MRRLLFVVFSVTLSFCLSSCELLNALPRGPGAPTAILPTVTYMDSKLVRAPSQRMMAAYYCPIVVPDVFLPGDAAVACRLAFGAPPSKSAMTVSFDLRYKVENPNNFPIPVAEMLTAATIFPKKTRQKLGAMCVVFCGKDQPGCTGQPQPDSCVSKSGDAKSLADFEQNATDLLISAGITLLEGKQPTFEMPEVVQDSEVIVTARFSFGPTALLDALEELARQSVTQLERGQMPTFSVPFRIEGTVWLDVGSLGRAEIPFGPAEGTGVMPPDMLEPEL